MPYRMSIRRFLNISTVTSPTFAPSGLEIAFVSNITGVPQVWKVSREGGWPERLTFYDERVSEASYSPTGDLIAFTRDTGGNERMQIFTATGDGHLVTRHTNDNNVMHNLGPWSSDGYRLAYSANARDSRFFDVHVLELDSGSSHMVHADQNSNHPLAWYGSDQLIARRVKSNLDHELLMINLSTGKTRTITPGPAHYSGVTVSGRNIYLITDHGRNYRAPAMLCPETATINYLWTDTAEVDELALDSKTDLLALLVNRDGYSELLIGSPSQPFQVFPGLPAGVMTSPTFSPDGTGLALVLSTATRPSDIWVINLDTKEAGPVTRSSRAGIPPERMTEPALIHYPTFDGLQIPAFLFLPGESAPPHPVVIDIHGGPEGQRRPEMNQVTQYLAHRGYAVLTPNVRGSSGYGREYIHLDDVEKRMDAVRDIEYLHRWIAAHPRMDGDRVAVMGGSYGGFMVLACLANYPDLWAAGVDMVGIANFETFLENTGPWRRRLREVEYGSLERDRDLLRSISPIHQAHRISAPLLVIHGQNDPRVPIGEAEQVVSAASEQGQAVDYLVFPDEGHGIVKLSNRVAAYTRIAEFFDRHLR